MQEAQNTKVVQDAYAAFSKGDIPALLNLVADDVVWHGVYGGAAHVPQAGVGGGGARGGGGFQLGGGARRFFPVRARGFTVTPRKAGGVPPPTAAPENH